MPLAWTPEWLEAQMQSCRDDKVFQEEADGNNRSYTVHVLADPDNGVAGDYWWGFSVPAMDRQFTGQENVTLVGTGTYVGTGRDRVHVRVERALGDFSLPGGRLRRTRSFLWAARRLDGRLAQEAARRGQPVPVVRRSQ